MDIIVAGLLVIVSLVFRINDQWRICFRFANGQASDVEIVDYH